MLGLGLVTLFGAIVVLLAFAPGIQRRAFLAALERPGRTVEVARLNAGLGGMEIEGLIWDEEGRRFTIHEARARFSFLAALGSGAFSIEELVIHGLRADVTVEDGVLRGGGRTVEGAPGTSDDAHAHGGDALIRIPSDVTIERLMVDGALTVGGGAEGETTQVLFELRGEALAAGVVARMAWRGRIVEPRTADTGALPDSDGKLLLEPSAGVGSDAIATTVHEMLRRLADAVRRASSDPSGAAAATD